MELLSLGDRGYGDEMLMGALITMELSVYGFLLALLIGTSVALATFIEGRILRPVIWALWRVYASIFMGVPSLLVVFIIFFGGSAMLDSLLAPFGLKGKIEITPFGAGAAALSIVYGAYLAEVVRGAILHVPRGQFEAAAALAIGAPSTWFYIIAPQVVRLALPGLMNLWVIVLKDTALVSLVGLNDLVAQAKLASGTTKQPFIFLAATACFFVLFNVMTLRVSKRLETRVNRGVRAAEV